MKNKHTKDFLEILISCTHLDSSCKLSRIKGTIRDQELRQEENSVKDLNKTLLKSSSLNLDLMEILKSKIEKKKKEK